MDRATLSDAIVEELGAYLVSTLRQAAPALLTADLDGIEQQLQELSRRVLGRVVEQTVAVRAAGQPLVPPPCAQCAGPLRLIDWARARHLQGLVGEYTVRRPYWHCARCHQGVAGRSVAPRVLPPLG